MAVLMMVHTETYSITQQHLPLHEITGTRDVI